jgi:hypothetical protein
MQTPTNAPRTRGAAIAAHCRECIHDPNAPGTWREQVAACGSTSCALWRFRPVQDGRSCPSWIKSRDPADLPADWPKVDAAEAVRRMRASIGDKANARAVQAGAETRTPSP